MNQGRTNALTCSDRGYKMTLTPSASLPFARSKRWDAQGTGGEAVKKLLYVMLAVCTVAAVACGSSKKKDVSTSSASPYVIGLLDAETGPNASPIRHNAVDL